MLTEMSVFFLLHIYICLKPFVSVLAMMVMTKLCMCKVAVY